MSKNKNKNKNGAGFTLVEILLIVAIFAIILSSAVSLTTKQIFESDLDAKSLEVVSMIERAQNHSVTGYRGDVWSIKVLNDDALCNDSGDCVLLFKGRDFSGRDTSYDRFVQFDQSISGVYIDADQTNEFYFAYKSGWLATSTASYLEQQNIVLSSNIGNQKSIVIQPSGVSSIFVCGEDKVFDINGNDYNTVKIATQCWMAENLRTGTMLASGGDLPTDNSTIEKWCYDDNEVNCSDEGALYDWDEMMAYTTTEGGQGICPGGWHIPADAEMDTLEANYSVSDDGYNLKFGGPSGFNLPINGELDPAVDATYYDSQGDLATLWTSRETTPGYSTVHYIDNIGSPNVMDETANAQNWGFGARCLKDY